MSSSSSTEFILEFKERPYGFRLVGDDCNKNAIVKSILNDKLSSKLNVGSSCKTIGLNNYLTFLNNYLHNLNNYLLFLNNYLNTINNSNWNYLIF